MVEFIEDTHTYLVDGIIVPSVTQVVNWKIGDDYSNVPQATLRAKAKYGEEVHELIRAYENGTTLKEVSLMKIDPNQKVAVKNYAKLKKKYMFEVKNTERIVCNQRLAGRYDILTTENELIDIKTTYRLNTESLAWQLGMYYYLLGYKKSIGYAMWLPKQTEPKFVMINCKPAKECEELLNEYIASFE